MTDYEEMEAKMQAEFEARKKAYLEKNRNARVLFRINTEKGEFDVETGIGDFKEEFAKVGWTFKDEDYLGNDFIVWGFRNCQHDGMDMGRTEVISKGKVKA